jgi:hypothetical protein
MQKHSAVGILGSCLALTAACTSDPVVVASNQSELMIDKVDLLLVVDDSGSMRSLQTDLPGLLDDLVAGSDVPGAERPALTDIHVAVVSTDMGIGRTDVLSGIPGCAGLGNDGLFISLAAADIAACDPEPASFLAFDGDAASAVSVDTVACLPSLGTEGCGFEQPLEAMLKSLWPADDERVEFVEGGGHGDAENAGFLRDDSLLIVMVVTDEDDCSTSDSALFAVNQSEDELALNLRCPMGGERLHEVERYVQALRDLREGDDPMLLVVLGGVPQELVDASAQAAVDWNDRESIDAYYAGVLEDPAMQIALDPAREGESANILPSCSKPSGSIAYPPRRLVQVAQQMGKAGVLGSICAEDFASSMANVVRAAAENL